MSKSKRGIRDFNPKKVKEKTKSNFIQKDTYTSEQVELEKELLEVGRQFDASSDPIERNILKAKLQELVKKFVASM